MVNKQYTIQHSSSINRGSNRSPNFGIGKRNSPPPVRSIAIISDLPNPQLIDENLSKKFHENLTNDNNLQNKNNLNKKNFQSSTNKNYEKILTENELNLKNNDYNSSTFARNIALSYDNESLTSENNQKFGGQHHFEIKDYTINDIGRFQYILQMDKEMGMNSDSMFDIPSRSSTINSSHHTNLNYWRAESETSMSSPSSSRFGYYLDRWGHDEIFHQIKLFWKYSKWPILLLISCILLTLILFFLFMAGSNGSAKNNNILSANYSRESNKFDDIVYFDGNENDLNNGNFNRNEEIVKKNVAKDDNELIEDQTSVQEEDFVFGDNDDSNNDELLAIIIRNPTLDMEEQKRIKEIDFEVEEKEKVNSKEITYDDGQSTLRTPIRNTQILRITTRPDFKADEEEDFGQSTARPRINNPLNPNRTILTPMKDSSKPIGFTSGHQNSFGVPIEEDERILRMLNEELIKYEQLHINSTTMRTTETTTAKVSPTLPFIYHHKDTSPTKSTTETNLNATDAGICSSTSLSICQGILQYDLTTLAAEKQLQSVELEHFKHLFDSKCSQRAAEFVCSALEPECRPSQMGILQPCKRICKSILEPCASIIASSEILTITFDCDRYPDSSDRNVCEDPTRRGKCLENEFQCLDATCIPKQWKCDNIKDCSLGEDEEECLFCDHEEFRCQSNDKCISDKWRCDQYDDCPDGSDELDCFDYDEDLEADDYISPRIYSFASIQLPDNPESTPFITIPSEEQEQSFKLSLNESIFDKIYPTDENTTESFSQATENSSKTLTDNEPYNEDEIQKGEESGRVVVGLTVPSNLANFQDSKEIMMTSDSEYSTIVSRNRNSSSSLSRGSSKTNSTRSRPTTVLAYRRLSSTTTSSTTQKPTTNSTLCPGDKLRCISGKCITVDQICDKEIDCPDGADEAMCVYSNN